MTRDHEHQGSIWSDSDESSPGSIFFSDEAIDRAARNYADAGNAMSADDRFRQEAGWGGYGYDEDYQRDPSWSYGYEESNLNYREQGQQSDSGVLSRSPKWDYQDHERHSARGGPGILLFAFAAVLALAVGLGFAAYRVLFGAGATGGNEQANTEQVNTEQANSDEMAVESGDSGQIGAGTVTSNQVATTTLTTLVEEESAAVVTNGLDIELESTKFVCDDTVAPLGTIKGADPNEAIEFLSPQSSGIKPGVADGDGRLPIRWSCNASQVGTTWELTALAASGRSVTVSFVGVGPDSATQVDQLSVVLTENPIKCDGAVKVFATISGMNPGAEVEFSSPQSSGIKPGVADGDGRLPIRWSCDASQVGTTWELTATEVGSNRTITFEFSGS